MGDDASSPTPDEIAARLNKLKGPSAAQGHSSGNDGPDSSSTTAGLAVAMRIGVELVSALMVGLGIGYGLDYLFGTRPWLMLVFFFVGSAAGFLNVWRTMSGQGYAAGYRGKTGSEEEDTAAKR